MSQGDIFEDCPILVWEEPGSVGESGPAAVRMNVRAIVLTQACDLAHGKATRVLVALVHSAQELVDQGVLKGRQVRDQIRSHRVYGWYFLPAGENVPESVVDLRDLHTIPRVMLEKLAREGRRLCRLRTPYREHLAQHFSTTYSRIGLPEPHDTE